MKTRTDWLCVILLIFMGLAFIPMLANGYLMGGHFGQHKISDTLSVAATTLTFPTVTNPTTTVLYTTFTCEGNVVCRPQTPTISGDTYFSVATSPVIPTTVAVGGTYSIGVNYAPPATTGANTGTLYPNMDW